MNKLFLILILSIASLYAQEEELITVIGDSMVGSYVNGETLREIYGNVRMVQGDVVITCNQAIQFISRNDAELIGDVVVMQDSLTITTTRGFYYGDERKAESTSGVKLDDRKVILTAQNGEYFFNENRAFFTKNVTLFDTTTTLTSDSLTYFRSRNYMVAVGTVKIVDPANIIEADSLQYYRDTRITYADDNVKITSHENNVVIFGNHLEDYAQEFYTLVNENPLLMQVDTTYTDSVSYDPLTNITDTTQTYTLDTLIIKANTMEAYRDTINLFKAIDSVKIVRGEFASKNDYTVYYRDDDKIVTNKAKPDAIQPVMWYENSQLTGDSITVFLQDNDIKLLELDYNAFIQSQNENYSLRYDQISGDIIKLNFDESGISSVDVKGTVYSIYYLYEEDEPNGLIKATSQNAIIGLNDGRVTEVRLYISPKSEYHPENMVMGKELNYTLPGFKIIPDRPQKEILLRSLTRDNISPADTSLNIENADNKTDVNQ